MATPHDNGLHGHSHRHRDAPAHRHVHHHVHGEPALPGHEHGHTTGFQRLTYIESPLHDLDARAKLIGGVALVLALVLTPPLRPLEVAAAAALLLATTLVGRLPPLHLLARSLLVVPFVAGVALLAPLRAGWTAASLLLAAMLVARAWLAVCVMLLVAASTPAPALLRALRWLRVPAVFVLLLSFIQRYLATMRGQLRALRIAVASRAPAVRGRRLLLLFGRLGGNLFVRAYDRGERVHAAMLSRGFQGTLPVLEPPRAGAKDVLFLAAVTLVVAALVLY